MTRSRLSRRNGRTGDTTRASFCDEEEKGGPQCLAAKTEEVNWKVELPLNLRENASPQSLCSAVSVDAGHKLARAMNIFLLAPKAIKSSPLIDNDRDNPAQDKNNHDEIPKLSKTGVDLHYELPKLILEMKVFAD